MLFFSLCLLGISAKSIVYISLKKDNKIVIYEEDTITGNLTIIGSETIEGAPGAIAISPNKKQLYVAQRSSNKISCYTIHSNSGLLTFVNTISAVDNPVYISTDNSGRFLLSAYFGASKIAIYGINNDGSLAPDALVEKDTPLNPHAINTSLGDDFLYVTCMSGDRILQYDFDYLTGNITPLSTAMVETPEKTGPRHFVFHPSSNYMFVANEVASSVSSYAISKSGYLGLKETLSALPTGYSGTNKSADIHISPDAKFLFVSNRGDESIAVFEIDELSKNLNKIGNYDTEETPREMAIDVAGNFLYAVGESSGKLQSYQIDRVSGALSPLENFRVGASPVWIEVVNLSGASNNVLEHPCSKDLKAFPNPFSVETEIVSSLIVPDSNLLIFSEHGQLVRSLKANYTSVNGTVFCWDGKSKCGEKVSVGLYKGVLKSTEGTEVISLLLLR